MGATPIVLVLVGLAFPIGLLLAAILFDLAVLIWAANRVWHDRVAPGTMHIVARKSARIRRYHFVHR